jgi:small subunit ribosomal protein S16
MVAADKEPIMELKEERLRYWLSVGATPTDKVAAILRKQGILPSA